MFYDGVLLFAVWFVATAIVLPFNSGKALTSDQYLYPVYLFVVSFVFFGWFWTHGGQTLGMRSWKIIVLTPEKQGIDWLQAALRFIGACLSWLAVGLGFVWILCDKNKRAWHDYLSRTQLFMDV